MVRLPWKRALFSREACTVLQRRVHASPGENGVFENQLFKISRKTL